MQKKILFINFGKDWGGGQIFLNTLAEYISNNFKVNIAVKEGTTPYEKFKSLLKNKVNIISCNPKTIDGVKSLIEESKNTSSICVQREHELWLAIILKIFSPRTKLIYYQQIIPNKFRFSLYLFDEIIASSKYIQTLMKDKYKFIGNKIKYIYPICDFPKADSNKSLDGNPKMLTSGAFYKEQYKLISIFKDVLKKSPKAHLTLVSPHKIDPHLEQLQNEIEKYGVEKNTTILLGISREEYLHLLEQCDYYLYTYTKEAFGFSVYEACTMNKIVMAFRGGGINEILEHYPKSQLFELEEKDKFATSLITSIKNKDHTKAASLVTFNSLLSNEKVLNDHLEFLYSIS